MTNLTYGVFLPFYALPATTDAAQRFSQLKAIVQQCEASGYSTVWLDDHLMYGSTPILETWTTLAALAAVTKSVRLGTMVTNAAFRNPALLAKMAATIDTISEGRFELGIGAGVQAEEHRAYGYPFLEPSARVERLREAIEILKLLWTQPKATYHGTYCSITEATCEPKPLQKPHPPITVGGSGENHTLKVTAQHANRADFGYLNTIEDYKHKLESLKNHCHNVGRNFGDIQKTAWPAGQIITSKNRDAAEEKARRLKPQGVTIEEFGSYSFIGTADELQLSIQQYTELGASHIMLYFPDLPDTSGLQAFAQTHIKPAN